VVPSSIEAMPRIMRIALSVSGSSTCTTWKRRVSAGSFSMCFLYSAQVVAPMVRSVPRASAGFSRFAASPVPAAPPAPTRVCVSSMNMMIGVVLACTSSMTCAGGSRTRPSCWRRPAAAPRPAPEAAPRAAPAARRRARSAARSPRPPRSCRRRPRRSGSGCSAGAASGCRRPAGSPRRGRRSGRSCRSRACSVMSVQNCLSASSLPIAAGAIAPDASPGAAPPPVTRAVLRRHPLLGRARGRGLVELVGQRVGLDLLELGRDAEQDVAQRGVLSMPRIRCPVRTCWSCRAASPRPRRVPSRPPDAPKGR
jgi:hypothetical protein